MLDINLQLFAEEQKGEQALNEGELEAGEQLSLQDKVERLFEEATAGDVEQTTEATTDATTEELTDGEQAGEQAGEQTEETPQGDNLILGKFKNAEEVFRGYSNLESDYTKKSQQFSEAQKMVETLKNQNEQLSKKLNELVSAHMEQPETVDTEEYMNQFYENPQEVIKKTVEDVIKKQISEIVAPLESRVKPVIEVVEAQKLQELWDNHTRAFYENNPDMINFKDGMKQYIVDNNLQNSDNPAKVLQDALIYAKGLNYQPQKEIDPTTLLADENFVSENILKNQDIVNRIIADHMKSVQGNNIPPAMTQPTGQSVATPPNKPKSMEDAHRMFEEMMKGNFVK